MTVNIKDFQYYPFFNGYQLFNLIKLITMSNTSKEYKIIAILHALSSMLLAIALFFKFNQEKPKELVISLAILAIILEFSGKFFAKTDPKAKLIAKTAGLISIPILIILLLF